MIGKQISVGVVVLSLGSFAWAGESLSPAPAGVHSAVFKADDKGAEDETEIKVSDLPAAVRDAVKAAVPKGVIKSASLVKKDGKSVYEVDVQVGKQVRELTVDASGKVLSNKVEEGDDDGNDDKNEKHEKEDHKK
jgi:hypothetical protein